MPTTSLKLQAIEVHSCGLTDIARATVNEITAILSSGAELHIAVMHSDLKHLAGDELDRTISILGCSVATHFRLCGAFAGQEDSDTTKNIINGIAQDILNYFKQTLTKFSQETNQLQVDIRMLVSNEDINLKKSYIDKRGNYSRPT